MRVTIFDNIKHEEKTAAIETLIKYSTPFQSYFLMVMLSVLMATLGLLMNNIAVIIGSMLIAPMLYPLLGLAMGVVMADAKLIFRSLNTFFKSILLSIIAAAVVTLFVVPGATNFQLTSEILSRTTPTLPDATIAIIAGLAASFALVKTNNERNIAGSRNFCGPGTSSSYNWNRDLNSELDCYKRSSNPSFGKLAGNSVRKCHRLLNNEFLRKKIDCSESSKKRGQGT